VSTTVDPPGRGFARAVDDDGPTGEGQPSRVATSTVPAPASGQVSVTRDPEAFTAWYSDECPRVFGYLLRRMGDRAAAEDLTAEVFTIAWKTVDGGVPRPGWSFVTARNLLSNQRRANGRFADLHRDLSNQIRTGAVPGFVAPPDEGDPRVGTLMEAVGLLSPEQRELLMARHWDELSNAECARLAGCSVAAVRVRLHRARLALAAAYRARMGVEGEE